MLESGNSCFAQKDGSPPAALVAGSAPGESGVSILSLRFRESAHLQCTPDQHLIWFHMSPRSRFYCRIAGRSLHHVVSRGSVAIVPSGIDTIADTGDSIDTLLVAVQPGHLSLASAEDDLPDAQLLEQFSGHDQSLFRLAWILANEVQNGYPDGPLAWNDVASRFIEGLLAGYSVRRKLRTLGALDKSAVRQVREYIVAHLDESIEVATLAKLVGRSPFHFSRMFARSVGMSPHRYIVHLRLKRAVELICDGRFGLAEVAVRTGFADQSHMSRWVKRVHGVSLRQLVA
jgi:AraC family transcriptional regulator